MKIFISMLWLLSLLLMFHVGHSALHPVAANDLLTLEISNLGPTRVILDHEKIEDVFFYPEEAASVVLHKSGVVFVVPKKTHDQFYLTVMGESGNTQDCHFSFIAKTPEPIRLFVSQTLSIHQPTKGNTNESNTP